MPIPAGSDVSTRLRTPGERSAPRTPARLASRSGWMARDGGSAVNASVPAITLAAEMISAVAGEASAAIAAVSSGPRTKMTSIDTESSAYAAWRSCGRSRSRSGHMERRTADVGGIANPAANPQATSTATGAPSSPETTSAPRALRVDDGERHEHAPLAEAVDEAPLHRRADAAARGQRPRHAARDRERPGAGAQVEHDRQRVDPDREARRERRRHERRHVRHAQDLAVAAHQAAPRTGAPAANSRARVNTASSIAGVSLPVNVFCWLGW